MANQVEELSQAIVAQGYRLTAARRAIIKALVDCEGHVSADDLAQRVHAVAPQVGRMTVYRTLDLLCELGQIRPIYQGTGAAHYILMAGGHHHHLICNRCHEVIEFDDCLAGELIQRLGQEYDFLVQSHLLELYGLCEDCREETSPAN